MVYILLDINLLGGFIVYSIIELNVRFLISCKYLILVLFLEYVFF